MPPSFADLSTPVVAPSLLSADFSRLREELDALQSAGASMIHLDVMDGLFVPNLTFGPPLIAAVRPHSRLVFDAHLMILNPLEYVEAFAQAGVDSFTFHVESRSPIGPTLAAIRTHRMAAGLTLRPQTPLETLFPYLDAVDLVLVMSVEPGFGGQRFLEGALDRLRLLRDRRTALRQNFRLAVDGGINPQTAPQVLEAGADILVAGSSVFFGPPAAYGRNIAALGA